MSLVLVTGGAGFIGSHLVEALLARSYEVRVLDNLFQGDRANLPDSDDLEFIEGDVTDYETCAAVTKGVEGVFHLAAMSKVLPSLENPDMIDFCTQQNVVGSANVLRAALQHRDTVKKLIYSGSSTVYGANPPPQSEDQREACQTPYAMSKYFGELYCELFTRLHRLPTIRLRYFMTYGPRQPSTGAYAVVTGVFMKQWENGEPLTIVGDGTQTRDFIHVSDIAEGIIRAFECDVQDATINVGTGRCMSINALADLFSSERIPLPPRPVDIPQQQADITRMRQLLDWEPRIEVVEYFKSLIRKKIEENPGRYRAPGWMQE
jgi:UDP-glucose 4-epimerase